MSRYAILPANQQLLVSWPTGSGDAAKLVHTSMSASQELVSNLARCLTDLSQALWTCYERPASASRSLNVNTEGWRRQSSREAFGKVITILQAANASGEEGASLIPYDPVELRAQATADCLGLIGDHDLTAAVIEDVRSEILAVERCEAGDLNDRGAQAVVLNRESVSPVQVQAAQELFRSHPLGDSQLMTDYEPAAAAAAAMQWFLAAVIVTSEITGTDASEVMVQADGIEVMPVGTLGVVLKKSTQGLDPVEIVSGLMREALYARDGKLPAAYLPGLQERQAFADEVAKLKSQTEEEGEVFVRLTVLDPVRPALDLLEDLLIGIRGCGLLFIEECASDGDVADVSELDEEALGERSIRMDEAYWQLFEDELREQVGDVGD